ncbi:hypothetical protein NP603_02500 [Methylomonas sp. SURF-1]|uniref:VCBS repeat-containing protein n=1 Tax=Methylomonas aurea TaxID=2952224 RepID=A0ABT1UCM9_9GAMM|nr:hypothetical protein [Methylomonas sp. SURF-1]MCQ8179969.1 hypothetical protein [Methylomonas sp. SURF-1]
MIIDKSAINLSSQHLLHQAVSTKTSLQVWSGRESEPDAVNEKNPVSPGAEVSRRAVGDTLQLSSAARTAASRTQPIDPESRLDSQHSLTLQIIKRIFKEITGRDFVLFSPDQLQIDGQATEPQPPAPDSAAVESASSRGGLVYRQTVAYAESETLSFEAEGTIKTKDGQSLSFSVSMSISRSFYQESNLEIRAGDAVKTDPLVINFDGNAAELSNTRFQFDIDADGRLEQIAALKSGSGMLALDRNEDGVINDGSELFGPASGNGFTDLAAYDEDGNQFIDAGDAVYQRLRIWQRYDDGSQQLLALGDKNIGAIYLGHLATPFEYKDEDNRTKAEAAATGLYFTEQGRAGTVQELNFVV